jgi:indole-3-glycerol phosphate synthase
MILDEIAVATRKRVEQRKSLRPPALVQAEAEGAGAVSNAPPVLSALPSTAAQNAIEPGRLFVQALSTREISFICEVKRASPSKGLLAPDFPYLQIAKEYEDAGAAAISVLTEPDFFMGSDDYLREIAMQSSIPVLRKDFIIDSYQIYEAKLLGAYAVLLICALLDEKTLSRFIKIVTELKLAAIVEAHNEREVKTALDSGARIIGVNNRDLGTFKVDKTLSLRLRPLVPSKLVFVAESGVQNADDVKALADAGVNAILIGEALMRSGDKKAFLDTLRNF